MGRRSGSNSRKLTAEIEARQRNIGWPDSVVNGRRVDEFLWKGSPNPTVVQRIGACLFGLAYLAAGSVMFWAAQEERLWLLIMISVGVILFGARLFRNGIRVIKQRKEPE